VNKLSNTSRIVLSCIVTGAAVFFLVNIRMTIARVPGYRSSQEAKPRSLEIKQTLDRHRNI
jgi:hypothetical protein